MKNILILVLAYALPLMPVIAASVPEQASVDNKAVLSVQKQPFSGSVPKQSVKNNWFCVVIQINGKVLDTSEKEVSTFGNLGENYEKDIN